MGAEPGGRGAPGPQCDLRRPLSCSYVLVCHHRAAETRGERRRAQPLARGRLHAGLCLGTGGSPSSQPWSTVRAVSMGQKLACPAGQQRWSLLFPCLVNLPRGIKAPQAAACRRPPSFGSLVLCASLFSASQRTLCCLLFEEPGSSSTPRDSSVFRPWCFTFSSHLDNLYVWEGDRAGSSAPDLPLGL